MILYDNQHFPLVMIHFRQSDWNKTDYTRFMVAIRQQLEVAIKNETPIKLLIVGNSEQKEIKKSIPMVFYTWLIYDILQLRPLFGQGLARTAIYTPDDNMNFFFDMLFKVYRPARPLERFSDMNRARQWLNVTDK